MSETQTDEEHRIEQLRQGLRRAGVGWPTIHRIDDIRANLSTGENADPSCQGCNEHVLLALVDCLTDAYFVGAFIPLPSTVTSKRLTKSTERPTPPVVLLEMKARLTAERECHSHAEFARFVREATEQRQRADAAEAQREDARRWAVRLEQQLAAVDRERRKVFGILDTEPGYICTARWSGRHDEDLHL